MAVSSIKRYFGDERQIHAIFEVSLWLKLGMNTITYGGGHRCGTIEFCKFTKKFSKLYCMMCGKRSQSLIAHYLLF